MTGRDLVIYILANGLENEPIFKNGRLLGFMTIGEAAAKFNVGVNTVFVWANYNYIPSVRLGTEIYIPANTEKPNPGGINA